MKHFLLRTAMSLPLVMVATQAAHAIDLGENAEYGKILGDFRYRYEHVNQDGLPEEANANTARLRLGYLTPTVNGFSAFLEGETIQYIGNDNFNDGSNGKTDYPSVNDPYDTQINQAYLSYTNQSWLTGATVGRQYIVYDNHRFLGWSKWRQNDTTHDAARVAVKPVDGLNLEYAYSIEAHRGAGSRLPAGEYEGDMNLLHADYALPENFKLVGYGYFLDFDDFEASSSRTVGGRLEWRPTAAKEWSWGIIPIATVEFAQQSDFGDNPNDYSEPYNWFEIGGAMNGYSLTAVYERQGGNGTVAMSTPLATAHSFTGWVDRIDNPPADGLVDMFATFKGPVDIADLRDRVSFELQLHHFEADQGDDTFGQEVDFGLAYTPIPNHTISAQVGHYMADELLSDTTKVWLFYDFKF